MNKIGIIGSGNIGANIAFFLAERRITDVMLYDESENIAQGKSLDLMEAAPIRHFDTSIHSASSLSQLQDTDLICIALDAPSSDPHQAFHSLVPALEGIADALRNYKGIVLLASWPNEACTSFFANTSALPSSKIFGIGTFVDSMRLRHLISQKMKLAVEDVQAPVFGLQGAHSCIIPAYISISGVPLSFLMSDTELLTIKETLQAYDAQLFSLTKEKGVYYAQAAAAAEIIEAVMYHEQRTMNLCAAGSLGVSDLALSTLYVVGKEGLREEYTLTEAKELGPSIAQAKTYLRSLLGAKG